MAHFNTKHGYRGTPTYNTWVDMRRRCSNPKRKDYYRYGGRGITVCEEWNASFEAFLRDMGPRPSGHTIERKNNNGNYCPGNCVWKTVKENCNNQRTNRVIEFDGRRQTLQQWAEEIGISGTTLGRRLGKLRWTLVDALTIPANGRRCGRTKHTQFLTLNGQKKTLKEWSQITGIKYPTLHARVTRYKMTPERALTR